MHATRDMSFAMGYPPPYRAMISPPKPRRRVEAHPLPALPFDGTADSAETRCGLVPSPLRIKKIRPTSTATAISLPDLHKAQCPNDQDSSTQLHQYAHYNNHYASSTSSPAPSQMTTLSTPDLHRRPVYTLHFATPPPSASSPHLHKTPYYDLPPSYRRSPPLSPPLSPTPSTISSTASLSSSTSTITTATSFAPPTPPPHRELRRRVSPRMETLRILRAKESDAALRALFEHRTEVYLTGSWGPLREWEMHAEEGEEDESVYGDEGSMEPEPEIKKERAATSPWEWDFDFGWDTHSPVPGLRSGDFHPEQDRYIM